MAPRMINYKPDSIVYFNGDKSNSVFLLKQGKIILEYNDIQTGEEIKDIINAGEFFGVKSGLIKYPREEIARVISVSTVIEFSSSEFEALISKTPPIMLKMLKSFSSQLRRVGKQVQGLVSTNAPTSQSADLFLIGDYYLKNKKYKQAATVYERYLRYYPEENKAKLAKTRIAKAVELEDSYGEGGGPTPNLDS
ncbi:MAG: hypothetical protein A2015_14065 [Spirochaetes bacterium GWF1_31_7]|nr:MAG: hypothetical protein A2Y30_03685 [Spirochaetes bacterium GWE1_32_154]OHD45232.1 MAG: hypothetical protein A2Y29_02255 [Spirochaetes bacterium GWE2_31_10]OHD50527.1 MAG: hypothetical protein A2015_14065 [Spirochaetes bacterium GWF1_31_7]OHD79140.1 MAG: hypothetical protein A2355_10985 [Spirochaetes bacterium RIFOXYB1_FULL_32_8]HBD94177.1 hypothetical protein [Spirochaetia bacterium]